MVLQLVNLVILNNKLMFTKTTKFPNPAARNSALRSNLVQPEGFGQTLCINQPNNFVLLYRVNQSIIFFSNEPNDFKGFLITKREINSSTHRYPYFMKTYFFLFSKKIASTGDRFHDIDCFPKSSSFTRRHNFRNLNPWFYKFPPWIAFSVIGVQTESQFLRMRLLKYGHVQWSGSYLQF